MKASLIIFCLIFSQTIFSQIAINTDNSAPDQSAILDVQSDTKGMLVPRMNTFQRGQINLPALGLLVFDTNNESFWYYDGNQWIDLGSSKILTDEDGDTYINPELSADNDRIYFKVENTTALIIRKNANNVTRLELGDENTIIGTNAGSALNPVGNSEGIRNTFYGNEAGQLTDSGLNNVGIGHKAFEDNSSGSQNTALGMNALANNTIGNGNVSIGQSALISNTLSSLNTAVGTQSGQNNTGGGNLFLGYGAGLNSSGDGNVFIGNLAGDNASGGNKLYINNKSSSFPLIYGEFNNQLLRINGSLNINGDYTLPTISGSTGAIAIAGGSGNTLNWSPYYFPSTSGTAGQTLILNNVGYLQWQSPSAGTSIIDDDGDSKVEIEKNPDEDKMRVTLDNSEKLLLETTNNTTRLELIGQENLIIGEGAGLNNTANLPTAEGVRNVYLGFEAGKSNLEGYGHTFVGYQAGEQSNDNVFATAVGWRAGWKTQGNFNAYFGRATALNNVLGEENTFIGDGAGHSSSGSGNIFLGFDAGADEAGDNKLYIDNSDTSTPLIHGDFDTNTLTVNDNLVSTNATTDQLIVNNTLMLNTTSPTASMHINLPSSETVGARIQVAGSTKFSVHNNGGISMGTYLTNNLSVPSNGLYVSGNVNLGNSTLHPTFRLTVDGKVACEEVNVELSEDWPDYVFEEEYDRMSLAELQKFIIEKKHLPGIPTAKEVKADGVFVGQMQKMMMEKIEELTLYIIEINEKNIQLEKEVELLKKAKI
jgi:hypothetical protein